MLTNGLCTRPHALPNRMRQMSTPKKSTPLPPSLSTPTSRTARNVRRSIGQVQYAAACPSMPLLFTRSAAPPPSSSLALSRCAAFVWLAGMLANVSGIFVTHFHFHLRYQARKEALAEAEELRMHVEKLQKALESQEAQSDRKLSDLKKLVVSLPLELCTQRAAVLFWNECLLRYMHQKKMPLLSNDCGYRSLVLPTTRAMHCHYHHTTPQHQPACAVTTTTTTTTTHHTIPHQWHALPLPPLPQPHHTTPTTPAGMACMSYATHSPLPNTDSEMV